ncbi:MAG: hypothetical protein KBT31_05610, partial [Firmicutes bacterium]|nr:hypothetical protein [Candidatus Colimorpha enterica]
SNTIGSYMNIPYAMKLITTLAEKENTITAADKTLSVEALQVTSSASQLWGIIIIGVVPLAVLAIGFIVWRRRLTR